MKAGYDARQRAKREKEREREEREADERREKDQRERDLAGWSEKLKREHAVSRHCPYNLLLKEG